MILTTALMVSCSFSHAFGQQTSNEELKTLIDSAFTHFPKMKEAENGMLLAGEKLRLTELNRQPEVTLDAGYNYIRPRIELPINGQKFQFAPVNNYTASLNGNYTLLDFGRQKALLEQSRLELTYSQHHKSNLQHQLAYQVANLYYYIVYLNKAIAIQDTIIATLAENKQVVAHQYQNGTALEIDLLSIISSMDSEENRKTELISLLNKQRILLEYIAGLSSCNGTELDPGLTPPQLEHSVYTNPELTLLNDQYRQGLQQLSVVRLKEKPLVGLRASAGTRNGYIPDINELRFNYQGGLSLNVPLYNGGKLKQQAKIQERIAEQLHLAEESLAKQIDKDLFQAYEELQAAQERLARTTSQVQLAKKAVLLASNKLRLGTGTHLELTAANTTLQRILLNQLQLQLQACQAKLEIGRLRGTKFW